MPRSDPPKAPSSQALFRFQVVSDVLSRVVRGELRADAIAEVAGQAYATGEDRPRKVSMRTIYRWLAAFDQRDLARLEPDSRQRTTTSVVLPRPLLNFVAAEKKADIRASLPEILRRAREVGVIGEAERIDRSTLYRPACAWTCRWCGAERRGCAIRIGMPIRTGWT